MNSLYIIRLVTTVAIVLAGLSGGSCIRDNYDDCPRPFRVLVKAIDADQNDITESGEVQQATLLVFNDKGQIVNSVEMNADRVKNRTPVDIKLDYPGHESLHFVVWGNIDDKVEMPPAASIKQLDDLYVKLKNAPAKSAARAGEVHDICLSPGDLFHGVLDVPVEYGGFEYTGDRTVVISRKTSQVTIRANHLKKWHGKEGEYSFLLHESFDTYDMDGILGGGTNDYIPTAEMDGEGSLTAPIFHTFPTADGKAYELDILFNGEVIFSADRDSDGKPFVPETGRLLNIIIDFRSEINTFVVVTPWNKVFQRVEI